MTTAMEAVEILGISYRQLDYWTKKQFIRDLPRGRGFEKSGYFREWPDKEIAIAERMIQLVDAGFTVTAAAKLGRRIVEDIFVERFALDPAGRFILTIDKLA